MKSCFVITPVGRKNSSINIEITEVIEKSIMPALQDSFAITAAHLMLKPGAINKQIVEQLCNADLAIANMTRNNPNVMYELAIRHMLGRPVILIANNKTKLPFDTLLYRTIFYDYNDVGLDLLKEQIAKAILEIDFSEYSSPVIDLMPTDCKKELPFLSKAEDEKIFKWIDNEFNKYYIAKEPKVNGNRKTVRIQLFQLSFVSLLFSVK